MLTLLIEETSQFNASLQWVAKEIDNLLTLFPTFTETVMAAGEVPDTIQDVTSSIQKERRVTIITGVAYSEDVEQSVQVIQNAIQNCDSVKKDEEIQIFPQAFGSSSIDIEVAWWTDPLPVDIRRSRGEVVTAVKRALDDAGIEIPFPYRTLTFKDTLRIKVLDLSKESKEEKS